MSVTWDVQIVRWGCNDAQNQRWDITWDSTSGAFTFVSPVSQKCWNNWDAPLGMRLNQFACDGGTNDQKRFFLEYQGYVANCGGSSNRKVRTPLPNTLVIACIQPISL